MCLVFGGGTFLPSTRLMSHKENWTPKHSLSRQQISLDPGCAIHTAFFRMLSEYHFDGAKWYMQPRHKKAGAGVSQHRSIVGCVDELGQFHEKSDGRRPFYGEGWIEASYATVFNNPFFRCFSFTISKITSQARSTFWPILKKIFRYLTTYVRPMLSGLKNQSYAWGYAKCRRLVWRSRS